MPFSASELQVSKRSETWEPQHFCKVAPYNTQLCILRVSESPGCPQPSKVTHMDLYVCEKAENVTFSASEMRVHRFFVPWEPETFCKTARSNKLRCILTASSLPGGHNPRNHTR